ncbi:MAG: hypothetical protein JWO76_3182 [Nocardioides sp.]|nr:hypothetical protein [Nocardioides sp.]
MLVEPCQPVAMKSLARPLEALLALAILALALAEVLGDWTTPTWLWLLVLVCLVADVVLLRREMRDSGDLTSPGDDESPPSAGSAP